MRTLVLLTILSTTLVVCFSQEAYDIIYFYGGNQYFQAKTTYPDGSYRLRLVLYDQEREEEGFFSNAGIWTVRGKVSWFNPEGTSKHTDEFQADDKGNRVKSSDKPESRAPPAGCGALKSLCG